MHVSKLTEYLVQKTLPRKTQLLPSAVFPLLLFSYYVWSNRGGGSLVPSSPGTITAVHAITKSCTQSLVLSDLSCLTQGELLHDEYVCFNWILGWILMSSNKKNICVCPSLLVVLQGLVVTSFISLPWLVFTQGHHFEMHSLSCLVFHSVMRQTQWFTDPSALWHTLVHGWEWEHPGNSYRTCTTVNGYIQCRPLGCICSQQSWQGRSETRARKPSGCECALDVYGISFSYQQGVISVGYFLLSAVGGYSFPQFEKT